MPLYVVDQKLLFQIGTPDTPDAVRNYSQLVFSECWITVQYQLQHLVGSVTVLKYANMHSR